MDDFGKTKEFRKSRPPQGMIARRCLKKAYACSQQKSRQEYAPRPKRSMPEWRYEEKEGATLLSSGTEGILTPSAGAIASLKRARL